MRPMKPSQPWTPPSEKAVVLLLSPLSASAPLGNGLDPPLLNRPTFSVPLPLPVVTIPLGVKVNCSEMKSPASARATGGAANRAWADWKPELVFTEPRLTLFGIDRHLPGVVLGRGGVVARRVAVGTRLAPSTVVPAGAKPS